MYSPLWAYSSAEIFSLGEPHALKADVKASVRVSLLKPVPKLEDVALGRNLRVLTVVACQHPSAVRIAP